MISSIRTIIGYCLALLGLTGLVSNVVEWHDFMSNIITEYQTVRDYVFGWLPFSVPDLVKDYFVVGAALSTSMAGAFQRYYGNIFEDGVDFGLIGDWIGVFGIPIATLFLWPILSSLFLLEIKFVGKKGGDLNFDNGAHIIAVYFLKYVGLVIVGFVCVF